jgi:hypothetical protein
VTSMVPHESLTPECTACLPEYPCDCTELLMDGRRVLEWRLSDVELQEVVDATYCTCGEGQGETHFPSCAKQDVRRRLLPARLTPPVGLV